MAQLEDMSTKERGWRPRSLSVDQALQVAVESHRRAVLRHLYATEGGECSVTDLAIAIAMRDSDKARVDLADGEIEGVYVLLKHVHLPKLVALDIVTYDEEFDSVALSRNAADMRPLIEFIHAVE